MRRQVWYLVTTLVLVGSGLLATILAGHSPVLGLDLQGGVSVVLAPVGKTKPDTLNVAVDIIRNRVDSLGVAEPEISRQGENVIIDLPGVKDRDKARRLVGKTAELRFRPVLGFLPAETKKTVPTTTTVRGASTTTAGPTTTTTAAPGSASTIPTTTPEADRRDATVVLPSRPVKGKPGPRYELGPTALTGKGVSTAKSRFAGGSDGWVVDLTLNSDGASKFNQLAAESFPKQQPQNAVAIVLDGVVQSAPAFRTSSFQGGQVQISGGFSQGGAKDLARLLKFGALPVQLKELTTQSVSPTLGKDQLRAGIVAGLIGLTLVAVYMLAYYRLLGLVVIVGLAVSAAAIYSLISYLGYKVGLALTLAGVTGLIVSVGITVDSYVVYFERLKDEVRTGKTVRSSVDRGFTKSFRTIVAADLVSLIGALVLYLLAVGSVRGFAFFLGLSTILDLLISYFFMHPLVSLLARRPNLVRAGGVGIAAGLDVVEARA
jgi:preprotein translocase subunit SecD